MGHLVVLSYILITLHRNRSTGPDGVDKISVTLTVSDLDAQLMSLGGSTSSTASFTSVLLAGLWCRSLSHHHFVTVAKLGWQLVMGVSPFFRRVSGAAPEGNIPLGTPKYMYLGWFRWPVATKE